jgi:lipopolysaccharide transport system ATP-binding protein
LDNGKTVSWGLSSEVVLEYRRLLHIEETEYFNRLAKDMTERAHLAKVAVKPEPVENAFKQEANDAIESCSVAGRSEHLSFGDGQVKIVQVETLDIEGNSCSFYYPGECLRIRVTCESKSHINKLNVAVRLRNKEGVKMYSWGTLNQDMSIRASNADDLVFWERQFEVGDRFQVVFDCACNLGVNLYEVQAAVSFEETPDYMAQRMLHWVDEAAFFQVSMKRDEYFFGGVLDLRMRASW